MQLTCCDGIRERLQRHGLGQTKDASLLCCSIWTIRSRCALFGCRIVVACTLARKDHGPALSSALILGDNKSIHGILVALSLDPKDRL